MNQPTTSIKAHVQLTGKGVFSRPHSGKLAVQSGVLSIVQNGQEVYKATVAQTKVGAIGAMTATTLQNEIGQQVRIFFVSPVKRIIEIAIPLAVMLYFIISGSTALSALSLFIATGALAQLRAAEVRSKTRSQFIEIMRQAGASVEVPLVDRELKHYSEAGWRWGIYISIPFLATAAAAITYIGVFALFQAVGLVSPNSSLQYKIIFFLLWVILWLYLTYFGSTWVGKKIARYFLPERF